MLECGRASCPSQHASPPVRTIASSQNRDMGHAGPGFGLKVKESEKEGWGEEGEVCGGSEGGWLDVAVVAV